MKNNHLQNAMSLQCFKMVVKCAILPNPSFTSISICGYLRYNLRYLNTSQLNIVKKKQSFKVIFYKR